MASLSKSERLKDRVLIQDIFAGNNKRVGKYPLLLLCQICNQPNHSGIQVLFSVSKKKFNRAVDRNAIKRRMREAFRQVKSNYVNAVPANTSVALAVIYTGKEIAPVSQLIQSYTHCYGTFAEWLSETT
jgi:ribonuclease P protein component